MGDDTASDFRRKSKAKAKLLRWDPYIPKRNANVRWPTVCSPLQITHFLVTDNNHVEWSSLCDMGF